MPSACHSWDEYLSFSRLLTISLDLWLAACLFLFLSFCTFLAVSLCLAFPPTLHLSLSTWLHLSIKCLLISDGYFLMPVSLSLSLVSFALFFMSKMVCWSALPFCSLTESLSCRVTCVHLISVRVCCFRRFHSSDYPWLASEGRLFIAFWVSFGLLCSFLGLPHCISNARGRLNQDSSIGKGLGIIVV